MELNGRTLSILAIILGLLMIVFPILGVITASVVIGLSILLLGIFLVIQGYTDLDYNKNGSIIGLGIGIIFIIFSLSIIFSPSLFAFLASLITYIAGLFLIIVGIIFFITERSTRIGLGMGITGVIIGLIYIIIGSYIKDPAILGALIGLWLIITGFLKLLTNKDYS